MGDKYEAPEGQQVLYDALYAAADVIVKHYNPCEIRDNTCLAGRIRGGSSFCCGQTMGTDICQHLGPNGCKVHALACKLWMCSHAVACNRDCADILYALETVAQQFNLLHYRASKGQSLKLAALYDLRHRLAEAAVSRSSVRLSGQLP